MLALVVVVTAISLHPTSRFWLKNWLFPATSRTLLAKAEGDLTGLGDLVTVLKVKTRSDLLIEVYSQNVQKTESALRARIILPERNDGFFEFRGSPTNLALVDINHDGILEIAAPTFDENMIPRLHIYRYDPEAQVFVMVGPDFFPLDPPAAGSVPQ